MRAGPLSNAKVIALLNQYFVPVHVDGVYVQRNDAVPAEEKTAYQQIFRALHQFKQEAGDKEKFSVGSVHAYVLSPEGRPMAGRHVAEATANVESFIAMLEKAVQKLKTPAGKPLVAPRAQSSAPKADADALVLHLTARYLVAKGAANARTDVDGEYVPMENAGLGTDKHGDWAALPSENWIVLSRAEWQKLLSADEPEVGKSWDIGRDVAAKLFRYFYPDTELNDLSKNRIDRQSLRATVVSIRDGVVRARLAGSLKMKHAFYPGREDNNFVDTDVAGYIDFATDKKQVRSLRLVTDKGIYGDPQRRRQHFGVAVRSLP